MQEKRQRFIFIFLLSNRKFIPYFSQPIFKWQAPFKNAYNNGKSELREKITEFQYNLLLKLNFLPKFFSSISHFERYCLQFQNVGYTVDWKNAKRNPHIHLVNTQYHLSFKITFNNEKYLFLNSNDKIVSHCTSKRIHSNTWIHFIRDSSSEISIFWRNHSNVRKLYCSCASRLHPLLYL